MKKCLFIYPLIYMYLSIYIIYIYIYLSIHLSVRLSRPSIHPSIFSQFNWAVFWFIQSAVSCYKLNYLLIISSRVWLITECHYLPQKNTIWPEMKVMWQSHKKLKNHVTNYYTQQNYTIHVHITCWKYHVTDHVTNAHHMSDSIVNFPCSKASGAIHLTGSFRWPSTW